MDSSHGRHLQVSVKGDYYRSWLNTNFVCHHTKFSVTSHLRQYSERKVQESSIASSQCSAISSPCCNHSWVPTTLEWQSTRVAIIFARDFFFLFHLNHIFKTFHVNGPSCLLIRLSLKFQFWAFSYISTHYFVTMLHNFNYILKSSNSKGFLEI